ncbi:DUF4282 domain-containing protein [Zophobihabitans entericus]|uniref:DUF4282 domain-containing protein n=1 Tax=Zophobihabitans entericus TaxID=1635327 RepID=A0A6G9ICE3_9GAMM|nr:DUF4282 domain-containing protein [Zophobihabitans entericus]QIQ21901.1 DUF4282 domain-containing protein [Zophobihabitans entericus]
MKKPDCKFKCNFDFKELLFFNRLVMPQILTVIYWIALVGVVLSGIFFMRFSFFGGLMQIIIGAIGVRISFELICVVFSINRNLEKLVALQSGEKVEDCKDSVCCSKQEEIVTETSSEEKPSEEDKSE